MSEVPMYTPLRENPAQFSHPSIAARHTLLVCEAHRLLYHSTLGLRVIKKKKTNPAQSTVSQWLQ